MKIGRHAAPDLAGAYWELQLRPAAGDGGAGAPGGEWAGSLEAAPTRQKAEVCGLAPGTRCAFRVRPFVRATGRVPARHGEWSVEAQRVMAGEAPRAPRAAAAPAAAPAAKQAAAKAADAEEAACRAAAATERAARRRGRRAQRRHPGRARGGGGRLRGRRPTAAEVGHVCALVTACAGAAGARGAVRAVRASGAAAITRLATRMRRPAGGDEWAASLGTQAVTVFAALCADAELAPGAGADERALAAQAAGAPLTRLLFGAARGPHVSDALAAVLVAQAYSCRPRPPRRWRPRRRPCGRPPRSRSHRAASFYVACSASAGLTHAEGRALGLKTRRCPGCVVARYCSPAGQAADWGEGGHKAACAALRGASEAAAAAVEEVGAPAL